MTQKRWLCLVLAVTLLLSVMLGGCEPGGDPDSSTAPKVTGEWSLPELTQLTGNTCTMLISNGEPPETVYTDLLKSEYGLTIEFVEAAWNERKNKLAAMVAAGHAPVSTATARS